MSLRAHTILVFFRTKYHVIARSNATWQSPGREPYHKTHARYFCTCVEKKAHTSKRVSIIACNNVISKEKCAPWANITPRGALRQRHIIAKAISLPKAISPRNNYVFWGPRGILCTRGEKAQTSKRQTNKCNAFVWSKAQFATRLLPISSCPRQAR